MTFDSSINSVQFESKSELGNDGESNEWAIDLFFFMWFNLHFLSFFKHISILEQQLWHWSARKIRVLLPLKTNVSIFFCIEMLFSDGSELFYPLIW